MGGGVLGVGGVRGTGVGWLLFVGWCRWLWLGIVCLLSVTSTSYSLRNH